MITTTVIKERVVYRFDLTKLEKIRLMSFNPEYQYGACEKALPGTVVTLLDNARFPGVHGIEFHIAPENVDRLLAVLKRLSPSVEISGSL